MTSRVPRDFRVTRTKDNQQLGLSVLIESLNPGETAIFRRVLPEAAPDNEYKKLCEELAYIVNAMLPYGRFMLHGTVDRAEEALDRAKALIGAEVADED